MAIGIGELIIILVILVFGLGGTAFWIWALVDCISKEPASGNTKMTWMIVIAITGWIGALIYVIVRRPERQRLAATGGPGPTGPR